MGFFVFLRYCSEISYFPELSLSALAGFFAAIFVQSFLFVLGFLSLWFISSVSLKDTLRQWEGYQKEGKSFVQRIYSWIFISLIISCLILFFVFGMNPQKDSKSDGRWFLLLVFCAFLMGASLLFSSRRLDTPLPPKLRINLSFYGGIWVFLGFMVVAVAYFKWGWVAMLLAIIGATLLLICSSGAVIPDGQATLVQLVIVALVIVFSFLFILWPPWVPTSIVQALGIGAYDNADVVVEKRYCESLVAEGIPLVGNSDSCDEDRSRQQLEAESVSYIEVMNADTILLKHIHVLLRVGDQIALRKMAKKKQGQTDNSIILIPAAKVLQVSEERYVPTPPWPWG